MSFKHYHIFGAHRGIGRDDRDARLEDNGSIASRDTNYKPYSKTAVPYKRNVPNLPKNETQVPTVPGYQGRYPSIINWLRDTRQDVATVQLTPPTGSHQAGSVRGDQRVTSATNTQPPARSVNGSNRGSVRSNTAGVPKTTSTAVQTPSRFGGQSEGRNAWFTPGAAAISGGMRVVSTAIQSGASAAVANNALKSAEKRQTEMLAHQQTQLESRQNFAREHIQTVHSTFEKAGLPTYLAHSNSNLSAFLPKQTQAIGKNTYTSKIPGNPQSDNFNGNQFQAALGWGSIL